MVLPVLIEPAEKRIDDSIHAFHVRKHDHGSCSSTDFNGATFDRVGGPQLPPKVSREDKEVQQLRYPVERAPTDGPSPGSTSASEKRDRSKARRAAARFAAR